MAHYGEQMTLTASVQKERKCWVLGSVECVYTCLEVLRAEKNASQFFQRHLSV